MVSHKISLITIFVHKYFKKIFITKLDIIVQFPNSVPVIVNVNVTLNFGGR